MRQSPSLAFHNMVWWGTYLTLGIWGQTFVPGVDLLLPAVIVSLQEGRTAQTFWLITIFTLIQDGTSAMAFGSGVFWYAGILFFFNAGRWIFETENPIFVSIVSILMGGWHVGLMLLMGTLQSMDLSLSRLLTEGAVQAASTPAIWLVLYHLRGRSRHSVHTP